MENHTPDTLSPDIEKVKEKFYHWRKNKKFVSQPIPEHLWAQAAEIARKHSINSVAQALSLNYGDLKEHTHPKPKPEKKIPFIEFSPNQPLVPEVMLEVENSKGSKLRMHFKGEAGFDLMSFAKEFMERAGL